MKRLQKQHNIYARLVRSLLYIGRRRINHTKATLACLFPVIACCMPSSHAYRSSAFVQGFMDVISDTIYSFSRNAELY